MFDEMLQYPQRWKSNANGSEVAPNCPRCASPNTKFCYYNNYSLSQPRYFCKGCRRYWTKGGSLRNVPVGGGCRKTRRTKSTRSSSSSSSLSAQNMTRNPSGSSLCTDEPSPEIDLAAVYANFLNRSSGSDTSAASSLEVNTNMIEFETETETENPCGLIDEARFGEVLPQTEDEGQLFMGESVINGFDMQNMIADELPAPESLPEFGWQPEEFGSFLPDDQLKISNNLIGESWGSFDILGYELFSRP